jgi:hypothetical protein
MQNRYYSNKDNPFDESGYDKEVIQAANILDKTNKRILDELSKAGVFGFGNIEWRSGYLPRIMDNTAVQNASTHGDIYGKLFGEEFLRISQKGLEKRIANLEAKALALVAKNGGKTSAEYLRMVKKVTNLKARFANPNRKSYEKVGKEFFDNMVRSGRGFFTDTDNLVRTVDLDALKRLIGDDDVAKQLFDQFQEELKDGSKSSRAYARIEFDTNKSTPDGKYKLSDLYSRNIRALGSRYAKESAGLVALAKKGIKSEKGWLDVARAGSMQERVGNEEYLKKMQDLYQLFLERPVDNATEQWARRVNEFTNLTMLGKTGLAQIADAAMIIANNGFVNTLRSTKEYLSIRSKINDGTAHGDVLSEIQSLSGTIGNDHILFSPVLDRIGEQTESGVITKGWSKYDELTGQLSRNLYYVNGMNHIKRFQQRVATIAATNKIIKDIARGVNQDRLRALGFDDKMITTVRQEIGSGKIVIGNRGGVTALNLNKWESLSSAQAFAMAVRRAVSGQVQDPLIGEGVLAMQRTVGALLLKLMTFPILSMQKQLAKSFYHHDMTSLALAGYGTLFGMAVYALNREASLFGSGDQGDALEELMDDPTRFIILGSTYNPMAGLLPDFANIMGALGLAPQEYTPNGAMMGREGFSNGVSVENIAGVTPTTSTVASVLRAAPLTARAILNGEVPDRAVYDIQAATPLGNSMLLIPLFNQMKDN